MISSLTAPWRALNVVWTRQSVCFSASRIAWALVGLGGQGLLGDRVASQLQGRHHVVGVEAVGGRHDDRVGGGVPDHLLEVAGSVDREIAADVLASVLGPLAVDVAQGDELDVVGVGLRQGLAPGRGAPAPGPHEGQAVSGSSAAFAAPAPPATASGRTAAAATFAPCPTNCRRSISFLRWLIRISLLLSSIVGLPPRNFRGGGRPAVHHEAIAENERTVVWHADRVSPGEHRVLHAAGLTEDPTAGGSPGSSGG